MRKVLKVLTLLIGLPALAFAQSQMIPPGPYGSSGGSSGGGGSTTPGGSNGDIQFNSSNTFGGTDNLFWDASNLRVGINTKTPDNAVQVTTSTTNTGIHVGPVFLGSAYGSGCGGCQGDSLLSPANAAPVGNEVYAFYMAAGGPYILNTPSGSTLQFRVGGADNSYYFDNNGVGALGINTNGALVSNGVLNVSGGNGALEWDQNNTTEFFVKNSSGGPNAASLITVENNNALGGQAEGWLYLPGGGYGSSGTHLANTVELYAHNNAALRLSTQESKPIDFWTNATVRGIINSTGTWGIGTTTPDNSTILDVSTTTRGSRPAPSMTTTQRNAITSPATGLQVFNTTTGQYEFYTGAAWAAIGGASPGGASGNVQYNNGSGFAGDNNLFWDATDHHLGINTTTPARTLDMFGFNDGDTVDWPILQFHGETSSGLGKRFGDFNFFDSGGHQVGGFLTLTDGTSGFVSFNFFSDGRNTTGGPVNSQMIFQTTTGSSSSTTLYLSQANSYEASPLMIGSTSAPSGSNKLEVSGAAQIDGVLSVNSGTNVVYYCSGSTGGTFDGNLARGNSNAVACSGGTWVATSLKVD